jgi:polyisoprenoid-binding protein YceI
MKKLNALFVLLLLAGSTFAQNTWNIDKAHSKVGFNVVHMGVAEVEGNFKEFDGTVVTKSDDFSGAEVTFSAKTGSIDTDNERRDGHLKSPDFFEAEKFPDLSFKGTLAKDGEKYRLKGNLTLKGVTKPAEFDVTYIGTVNTGQGTKAGFKLNGEINRQEYGVTWNNKLAGGELVVSDKVQVVAKIELNKKA